MFAHSYIATATDIIDQYNNAEPFHLFLKRYFAAQKKFGSRDRKHISHICYCYYRLGHSFKNIPVEERFIIGLFLCTTYTSEVLRKLKPEWDERISLPLDEKIVILNSSFINTAGTLENIFPWRTELSEEINKDEFNNSFLTQPDLFLRVRPGYKEIVTAKLQDAGVTYQFMNEDCIALPNSTKLDSILELDREAIVQDQNSQQTISLFKSKISNHKSYGSAWDCCAGSGGKSILLHDIFPEISLAVSDIRQSIIQNLHVRFKKAGIKDYHSFIADLTISYLPSEVVGGRPDIIVCDAPCTGSGSWGRTPEQMYFFNEKKIEYYASLQKRIAVNASKKLHRSGYFLYITCSVFKKENEEVVDFLQENTGLQLEKMEYLKGYNSKADTLFSALFTSS